MSGEVKTDFLRKLSARYGPLRKLQHSQSLYDIGDGAARVYIRYSRTHDRERTFYGLRAADLKRLEGRASLICFLWDGQGEPLLVPFSDYEDVFQSVLPAGDGQYKAQIFLRHDGTELYIARAGRFNVEGHLGWSHLDTTLASAKCDSVPDLSHAQVQTLLGAIGAAKNYDVWIPPSDRGDLDWRIAGHYPCSDFLPYGYERVHQILQEVDVVWIERGSAELRALYEVEHSTPVYSGLLRFNDIHLVAPELRPTFSIVANDARRSVFVRHLNRPTFKVSGLSELCTFLEYANVFNWHSRLAS